MALIALSTVVLGNTLQQYAVFAAIVLGAMFAGKLVTWASKNILHTFAKKTETKLDDVLMSLLEGPILLSIFLVALHFARLELTLPEGVGSFIDKALIVLAIINVGWYLARFLAGVITHYLEPLTAKTETDLDDHLIPLIKRTLNIIIVLVVAIIVLAKLGYNVTSLVAGLGIGGLALALAAQDILGNFFGGIAIITDRPFKVGDRIKIGTDVDGFVRDIGLRTTRVETLASTMVIVPNKKVIDSIVVNVTNERARQIIVDIGVEYGTSTKKLEEAKRIIEKHVKRIEGLDDECAVAFSGFGDSALNIKVIFWINKEGMERFWQVQDELNTSIKRDFEKARISFAFPSQTVYVRKA